MTADADAPCIRPGLVRDMRILAIHVVLSCCSCVCITLMRSYWDLISVLGTRHEATEVYSVASRCITVWMYHMARYEAD